MKDSTLKENQVRIEANPIPKTNTYGRDAGKWSIRYTFGPGFPDIKFLEDAYMLKNGEQFIDVKTSTKIGAKINIWNYKRSIKILVKELKKDKREGWSETVEF